VTLVTISREYGSGGRDLAKAVGEALGWYVLDHDLISRVAQRLELAEETVERMDEQPPGWLTRLASALLVPMPESPVPVEPTGVLDPDSVAKTVRDILEEAAQSPPVVIVGHGAQSLFHDRQDAIHVRVIAPIADRVTRLVERYGWDAARAESQAHRLDRERKDYVQRYYGRSIDDTLLYDVVVNTGRVRITEAAAAVATLVRSR
jgi:cytidylate kinase